VNIDEEFGPRFGRLIVIAKHIDAVHDFSVSTYQVARYSNISVTYRCRSPGGDRRLPRGGHDPGTTSILAKEKLPGISLGRGRPCL
jgi:hypothetical protein